MYAVISSNDSVSPIKLHVQSVQSIHRSMFPEFCPVSTHHNAGLRRMNDILEYGVNKNEICMIS